MTVSAEGETIEAIKRLKARYFRLMDTKQWAASSGAVSRSTPAPR
jgi:hypothetical protein